MKKRWIWLITIIAVLCIVVTVCCFFASKSAESNSVPGSGASLTILDGTEKDDNLLTVQGMEIEQAYELLLREYLVFAPSVSGLASPTLEVNGSAQSNPFYERTERLSQNAKVRTALSKAGGAFVYEVISSDYTHSGNSQSYVAELSYSTPDIDKALREHYTGTGTTVTLFSDHVADYLSSLSLDTLSRTSGVLYVFYEKGQDGAWRISSITDPLRGSLCLPEFGGIQLYRFEEQAKEYPVYLPLGNAREVSREAFVAAAGEDTAMVGVQFNAYAATCAETVVDGLTESSLEKVFTDNPGVVDGTGKTYYLEDTAHGAELYTRFQELEVNEEKAQRAQVYMDFADCEVKYYIAETDGVRSYMIALDYTYLNRTSLDKLCYGKLKKSPHSLSIEQLQSFAEENKKALISSGFLQCSWGERETIMPDRMLMNNLATLVEAMTFGGG